MYICIYRLTQTRAVTCFTTDPSSRQGGRPTTNETATVLTTAKIGSRFPEGLNAKTDGLTDRQLYSDSGSDSYWSELYQRELDRLRGTCGNNGTVNVI